MIMNVIRRSSIGPMSRRLSATTEEDARFEPGLHSRHRACTLRTRSYETSTKHVMSMFDRYFPHPHSVSLPPSRSSRCVCVVSARAVSESSPHASAAAFASRRPSFATRHARHDTTTRTRTRQPTCRQTRHRVHTARPPTRARPWPTTRQSRMPPRERKSSRNRRSGWSDRRRLHDTHAHAREAIRAAHRLTILITTETYRSSCCSAHLAPSWCAAAAALVSSVPSVPSPFSPGRGE